ncbi:MAG TPA: single-stranded-DNA-specific exonuclease RecJ [Thermodesulfobacteriota bacterium]|nr:single-stranded-DNA-specific exonuclease RecJ [Thermodesulfobacteriota bacterium]
MGRGALISLKEYSTWVCVKSDGVGTGADTELETKKRWKVSPADKALQEVLSRGLDILPLTAQLLINRGLVDCDRAFNFLRPDLKDLHDPFLMKGMDKAVSRILKAIEAREGIAVYGDYDVDGTTSAALLHLFFKEIGVDTTCYIPDRISEGYGLNAGAIKKLHRSGTRVIITTDCGITNNEEIAFANSLGVDVIVTDHHEPGEKLPPACAIVNPKQKGCTFPFKGLAGVGVAFKLVMALRAGLRKAGGFVSGEPNLRKYLDLVSIGTVSDMVPLIDENRILVSFGIKELERSARAGLKALKDVAGIRPGRIDAYNIAFQLAPRINAAGRVAQAEAAFKLLVTENSREAAALARELDGENTARQKIEMEIFNEAVAILGEDFDDKGIVLFSEGWHPGVLGIVASRLVERYAKPAVMIAVDSEQGRGSARGIKSFSILEGLEACKEHLERFGGHKAAAGLTVRKDRLEDFRDMFLRHLNDSITDDDLIPEMELDAAVNLENVDFRLISEIETLSPFGMQNREPLFCLADTHIIRTEVVGGRHLKFRLRHKDRAAGGIGFGLASLHPVEGEGYRVAFSPYVDEWGGSKSLGLRIKDVGGREVKLLT